jgi:anti-sigma-K factor RskA
MAQINPPDDWQSLLAGYVLGDLSPAEMQQVNHYLEQHPDMQTEVQRLQTTLAILPLSLPDKPPADRLRTNLLAATEARLKPPVRRSRRRWGPIASGAIAAAVIAGLGIGNYRLQTDLTVAQQEITNLRQAQQTAATMQADMARYRQTIALLEQPHNRLLTLQGMTDKTASGSLVIAPQQKAAVLTLQNLTPPKAGMVYRLWAMVDGQKMYCSEFMPSPDGKVLIQLPADRWQGTTSVAITVEPATASPQSTSDMVMTGSQI